MRIEAFAVATVWFGLMTGVFPRDVYAPCDLYRNDVTFSRDRLQLRIASGTRFSLSPASGRRRSWTRRSVRALHLDILPVATLWPERHPIGRSVPALRHRRVQMNNGP
ncbi:hypothetical protein OH77DRAFT_966342 [Trametes cingulata]|nr:hypothetical protein OH77DRAFT_966342 [Trametes cingulata]